MKFQKKLGEHERRRATALAMGGPERLAKRRSQGILNARERLDLLFDPGSFTEAGLFAVSDRPEDRANTPADGKIAGFGQIGGRPAAVVSNDLTVKGASSSRINLMKMSHARRTATRNGMPIVFLGESSGARMPDTMGARGMGAMGLDPEQYIRMRQTPWVSAMLGPCFGSAVWFACLSDFVVMRKGATMAVSSAKVTSIAIKEEVDSETLGGWRLQTEVTGQVDMAVDSDEEAIAATKRFLSYLPSHQREAPPIAAVPAGSDEGCRNILDLVPEERSKVYDMRKVVQAIADRDSYFPLKERFGRAVVTALARLGGRSVGFIATNPLFKAGAMDPDACDKMTSFLVLCDSFNIPIVILVDTPGFLIGLDGERKKAPGKIMNNMQALQMCTVPKISVVLRKSYGQAYLNLGGGRNSDEVACWFSADVSFMDPTVGVNVVYGVRPEDNPEEYARLLAELSRDSSPYDLAGMFAAQTVIDPRETRDYLIRALGIHSRRLSGEVGQHLLSGWPTTY